MKIISVVGARPQFIKYSAICDEIRKKYQDILIHTGQHYDYEMNKVFFDELKIHKPDYNLKVGSGSHGYQTGEMLKKIEAILLKEKPDLLIVYGDTNSTLAGALAASKLNIPVAHVEAGLREFDMSIPEEINKIIVDHVSSILFTPSKTGIINLKNEGITKNVYFVGDITLDLAKKVSNNQKFEKDILGKYSLKSKDYYYFTMHRQKNTDDELRFQNILDFLCEFNEKRIIFPVHPRTKKNIIKYNYLNKLRKNRNLKLFEPIGYQDSIILIKNAIKTITDSGGVIKESYFLKTPSIIVDDTTEWIETIEDGWSCIVGADKKQIFDAINKRVMPINYRFVYGNGNAGKKVIEIIERWLNEKN